jgi:hypothetical protein
MAAKRKPTTRARTTTQKPPLAPSGRKRPSGGVTLDQVRELALALPETLERPCYGTPGFRVRDKLFARVLEDGASIVVKVDFDVRDGLVASAPEVFAVTPHYQSYPWVIVRLGTVEFALLRDLLAEAWRSAAPRRIAHLR